MPRARCVESPVRLGSALSVLPGSLPERTLYGTNNQQHRGEQAKPPLIFLPSFVAPDPILDQL